MVNSLLNGIRNRDDILVLQMRLRSLPRELEPLYKHLLNLIEPLYLEWASRAFQLLRTTHELNEIRSIDGLDTLSVNLLYLAINDSVSLEDTQDIRYGAMVTECEDTIVQLTARCAGMLEISHPGGDGRSHIVYLHATTRNFLEKDENWSYLLSFTSKTDFNPYVSLMKALALDLFLKFKSNGPMILISTALEAIMTCASYANADSRTHKRQNAILDHLDKLVDNVFKRNRHWRNKLLLYQGAGGKLSFLELTALYNLTGYVGEKLAHEEKLSAKYTASSLLQWLLRDKDWLSPRMVPLPKAEVISLLIHYGADSNWKYPGRSTWENVLHYFVTATQNRTKYDCKFALPYARAMKILIAAGADPRTPLFDGRLKLSVLEIVERYVMPLYPDEGAEVVGELERVLSPAEIDRYKNEIETRRKV